MDVLLHIPISMAKRPCPFASSSSSVSSAGHNPGKLPAVGGGSRNLVDQLLESFLSMADSPSFPLSLDCAFDRILASAAVAGNGADQTCLIDRAINLGSLLLESANRCSRKRASIHNSLSWPLPPDLTIKVFSMLDTQSLIYAAASCSMFHKSAMDPLCYSHIDLTTVVPKVNNAVVSTMIQRAGKALRSLKLGIVPGRGAPTPSCQSLVHVIRNTTDASSISWNDKRTRKGKELSILTRSCLNPLCTENGSAGTLLRSLHLYNIELMDNTSLCMALSACPYLIDLEIVGLHVELKQVLESVTRNCHLIERLFFESSKTGSDDSLKASACVDFVSNCPNLTSLALRGFKLHDVKARILVKGFRKLEYLDLSTSYSVTGHFLRNLGNSSGGNLLKTLVLRDCMHLKEVEVARFLTSIVAGEFKFIRHIDISNKEGLASEGDWYKRSYHPNLPLEKVKEERPGISILADFTSELAELRPGSSFYDVEQMLNGESSDMDLPSGIYDNLFFSSSSSESSYSSSDQSSGNEGSQDSGHAVSEEGSDDVDFLFG